MGEVNVKYWAIISLLGILTAGANTGRLAAQDSGGPILKEVQGRAPEFPRPASSVMGPSVDQPPVSPGVQGAGAPRSMPSTPEELSDLKKQGSWPQIAWINSPPLTMAGLRGKVVLIDFWEYTCINCIRTFPENKKWYKRYHKYGFEIIGVHDPEFDIAYPVKNVKAAVKRFGLPYPVVVDDWFTIWREYHNTSWPNRFLIDAAGNIRYNVVGEGANGSMERAIQELLKEAHPGLKFPSSYTIPPDKDTFTPACGLSTPEMYVGFMHGRGILSNAQGYHKGKTLNYRLPAQVADGHAVVSGRWKTDNGHNPNQSNGMIYRGKKQEGPAGEEMEIRYHARELYSVMNVEHGRPSRVYIRQDGKDLTAKNKGVDVRFDSQGHSYIEVREPRMYYLVSNPTFSSHKVELFPTRPGLTINSFTFGNNCQIDFPHL